MSVQSVDLGPTGHVMIDGSLNTADLTGSMTIGSMTIDGGSFVISTDSVAPIEILGGLTISHDGKLVIGRDLDGSLTVDGNMVLDTGGELRVGRNLTDLTVGGNLIVNPTGSGIAVGGQLDGMTVDGYFQGQGGTSAPTLIDLGVGLNLNGLTILGGKPGVGGLINANIRAGGTITGVVIVYGSVNSTIEPNSPPPT
jgi:hypothetical protein